MVYSQGEDGYIIAECQQLPGCMSQGKTKEEAARNIRDAIQSVLSVRLGQVMAESQGTTYRQQSKTIREETLRVKDPELISV